MDIVSIFSSIDTTVLTITLGFFGIYAGIHFSLIENVGNLDEIKVNAIKAIAKEFKDKDTGIDGIEFIDYLYATSKVLVLPAVRKDKHFKKVILSFLVVSVITIFYAPVQSLIGFLPEKGVALFAYSFSFGIAVAFLWYQVTFFREFNKLQRAYPGDNQNQSVNFVYKEN